MRLLAIDTALEACAVGVTGPGGPVIRSEVIGRGHAERLFGMVEEAMAAAGLAFADLDRIAVTAGPGSFTGLRVGIAAARGFALVAGCPAFGISTLAAHAETARPQLGGRPVLTVLDARAGGLYGQLFAADGTPLTAPAVETATHFADLAAAHDACLVGAGARLIPGGPHILHELSAPDMQAVLALAARAGADASPPKPLYLRPPDAKPAVRSTVALL